MLWRLHGLLDQYILLIYWKLTGYLLHQSIMPRHIYQWTLGSTYQVVNQMLREESQSFFRSDNDIGCAENLQMNTSLTDNEPVTPTYLSVPKPLYQEMKNYLQDFWAQGLMEKSTSSYSSLVVCRMSRQCCKELGRMESNWKQGSAICLEQKQGNLAGLCQQKEAG